MFEFTTVISLLSGTLLLMWLGEQITDKGIGNGISMVITVNIVSRLPAALAAGLADDLPARRHGNAGVAASWSSR